MLTLFHPFPTRVAGLLAHEISTHGWRLEITSEPICELWLFDSVNRQLLSGGLILRGHPSAAQLLDAEGTIRWEGALGADSRESWTIQHDPQLEDLIAWRLDEWRLVKVARVSCVPQTLRAWPKPVAALGEERIVAGLMVHLTTVTSQPTSGLVSEGVLVEIEPGPDGAILAQQLCSLLVDCGGIRCPWPFMLLAQRAAAAAGWIDAERMWNGRDKWADVVRVLVQLLRMIRDESDPASVQEARTLLNHLRILIDLGRKLHGKPSKAERYRGLKELRVELSTLRSLDVLCQFLNQGALARSEHWVGIPGVIASCPAWTSAHAAALLGELETRRIGELARLRQHNRYISDPDTIIELSASWPPFPKIEKNDSLVRGRWQANLEIRIHKLARTISAIAGSETNQERWLEIRRRCRKIIRVMDACSDWADHKELRFFRRMAGVWYKRLGELEAMQSNILLLQAIAQSTESTVVTEAANLLINAMRVWLESVQSQLQRTIPALGLSAKNARKKLA